MPAASIGVDFVANTARWTTDIERAKTVLNNNAAQMNSALSGVEGRFSRVGASSGAMRSGFQQLSFQINDVAAQMANGTKASVIFAQQSGQVIQAIQLMAGGSSKFASFMGGPWGIGISVGVSALSALWSMHQNTAKAAGDSQAQHLTLSDALQKVAYGTDAARKALQDYNAEQDKARKGTEAEIKLNLAAAAANYGIALSTRAKLQAELDQQGITAENFQRSNPESVGSDIGVSFAKKALEDNQAKIDELKQGIRNLQIEDAVRNAKAAADPITAINNKYDDMGAAARKAAAANDKFANSLSGLLTQYEKQRKAEIDKVNADKRSRSGAHMLTPGEVGGMLTGQFGGTITSTTGGKHAKNSYHYAGQAVDFVPSGGMGSITKDQIRASMEAQGVVLKELLGPGDKGHSDHFHIAFAKAQRSAEETGRTVQTALEKAANDQKQFADLSASLDAQVLTAKRKGVTDTDELARIARDQVNTAKDRLEADLKAAAVSNPIIAAQQDVLKAKIEEARNAETWNITFDQIAKHVEAQRDMQLIANDNQLTMLRIEDQMALTQADRRRIQTAILKAEEANLRIELQKQIDATQDADKRRQLRAQLDAIPAQTAAKKQALDRDTAGPLEDYLNRISLTPDQVNERVQGLVVDELEAVRRGIDDAITSALGIKDPLLAGLVDLFIQQVLIRPIAEALQGVGGMGGGGLFGSILGGFGHLLGFADGTSNAPPGYAWVGERGPEIVKFRGGEQVIPNHALGGGSTRISVEASPYFDVRVNGMITQAAPAIAKAGSAVAQREAAYRQSRSLAA